MAMNGLEMMLKTMGIDMQQITDVGKKAEGYVQQINARLQAIEETQAKILSHMERQNGDGK